MKELFSTNSCKIVIGALLMLLSLIVPFLKGLVYIVGAALLVWGLYPLAVATVNKYVPAKYRLVAYIILVCVALVIVF